jgi:hypothetical protein
MRQLIEINTPPEEPSEVRNRPNAESSSLDGYKERLGCAVDVSPVVLEVFCAMFEIL